MTPQQTELVALAVGGVAIVAIVALRGRSSSVGATFAAPNPQSVAAVQSAAQSEVASVNALTLAKMQTAASAVVALAQLQTGLDTARVTAGVSDAALAAQTQQVGLQTDAAEYASQVAGYQTAITSAAQTTQAQLAADVAKYAAGVQADSAARVAAISAQAQTQAATINAGLAKDISNNEVTAARIGHSTSFGSVLSGFLGDVVTGVQNFASTAVKSGAI